MSPQITKVKEIINRHWVPAPPSYTYQRSPVMSYSTEVVWTRQPSSNKRPWTRHVCYAWLSSSIPPINAKSAPIWLSLLPPKRSIIHHSRKTKWASLSTLRCSSDYLKTSIECHWKPAASAGRIIQRLINQSWPRSRANRSPSRPSPSTMATPILRSKKSVASLNLVKISSLKTMDHQANYRAPTKWRRTTKRRLRRTWACSTRIARPRCAWPTRPLASISHLHALAPAHLCMGRI